MISSGENLPALPEPQPEPQVYFTPPAFTTIKSAVAQIRIEREPLVSEIALEHDPYSLEALAKTVKDWSEGALGLVAPISEIVMVYVGVNEEPSQIFTGHPQKFYSPPDLNRHSQIYRLTPKHNVLNEHPVLPVRADLSGADTLLRSCIKALVDPVPIPEGAKYTRSAAFYPAPSSKPRRLSFWMMKERDLQAETIKALSQEQERAQLVNELVERYRGAITLKRILKPDTEPDETEADQ